MRTLTQNCEQTLQKLRTNRIVNKRAFLSFVCKKEEEEAGRAPLRPARKLIPKQFWSGSVLGYFIGGQRTNTNLVFTNFSGAPGISQPKSRDIPLKGLFSLGFKGHTELFGPHPFTWKTPTLQKDIQTQKFEFVLLCCA